MRESVTGHSLFNDNQMTRALDDRAVLLLESDADLSVIGSHLSDDHVRPSPGFSKSAVLLAARLHSRQGDDWVLGVVDRDFEFGPNEANVISTSHYDLEAEVFARHEARVARYVYSHLVSETAEHDEAKRFTEGAMRSVRELAGALGVMRKIAHETRLGISFSSLPMRQIVSRATQSDFVEAAAHFACLKARKMSEKAALEARTRASMATALDVSWYFNGHDLLRGACALIEAAASRLPGARDFDRGFHALVDCSIIPSLGIWSPVNDWLFEVSGETAWDCVA